MFAEVEGIIRRQINVGSHVIKIYSNITLISISSYNLLSLFFQMSLLPSVQPFHAIAYPIDPMLALDIRFGL